MNQNNEVLYFDSSLTNDDALTNDAITVEDKKGNSFVSKIKNIIDTFLPAIIVSIIVYLVFQFVLLNGTVPSGSMESTILTGNLILTNRLAYINDDPITGDIIVFWSDEHNKLLVKRVIGVAGDVIELKGGKVYINGAEVYESYIQGETWSASIQDERFEVPEGKLFVMGDNRENSGDSRFFKNHFIDVDSVEGKVFLHYSLGGDDGVYAEIIHSEAPIVVK